MGAEWSDDVCTGIKSKLLLKWWIFQQMEHQADNRKQIDFVQISNEFWVICI